MADKKDKKKKQEVEEEIEAEEEKLDGAEGEDGDDEDGEEKSGGKKKIIIIAIVAILGLAAVAGGLIFGGIVDLGGSSQSDEELALLAPRVEYYTLDEFLVNLNNPGKQVSFLKMKVTLELPNLATRATVESKMPHIRDTFQIYLRELRSSDLQGSAALVRLREELTLRLNKVIEPDKVTDILFVEILVQ